MTDTCVQPMWVVCAHERMRLQISLQPDIANLVTDGKQMITIRRDRNISYLRDIGYYIENTAVVINPDTGLIMGLHRRVYINWRTPAEDPIFTYSRFFTRLLGLPLDIATKTEIIGIRSISLLQFEKFGR